MSEKFRLSKPHLQEGESLGVRMFVQKDLTNADNSRKLGLVKILSIFMVKGLSTFEDISILDKNLNKSIYILKKGVWCTSW